MNQIPKRDPYAEETARIREVVARHSLPEFVTGFDVRLGEFDGDPAMWIMFKTRKSRTDTQTERLERAAILGRLRRAVQYDLLEAFDARYPYFRFISEEYSGSAKV